MSVVFNMIARAFLLFLRMFTVPIFRIMQIGKYQRCPPITNKLLLKSGTNLVAMIKNKQVTSEEVVRVFIQRCKEVNPIINAIVQDRFDQALADARAADNLLQTDPQSALKLPLFGIPISVKESIAVQGMSHNAGRKWPDGQRIAEVDAHSVNLARAAGAIPIVVTNTPELCMLWETYNKVTGVTRNPYDTRRTPAGSSGGEAALISSAGSVIGIGSDIGGSLRLPAMFTGIFGHKPSPGVVSPEGHMPGCPSEDWYKYFTIGPMTRYAEDLPLLLKTISDPTGPEIHLDEPVDVKSLKFYYMEDDGGSIVTDKISPAYRSAFINAIQALERENKIKVEKVCIKKMKKVFNFAINILLRLKGIQNIYQDENDPDKQKGYILEVIKLFTFTSNSTAGPVFFGPAKDLFGNASESNQKKFVEINSVLKQEFQELLGDNGVFLYPTYPNVAHFHNEIFHNLGNTMYMLIFNTIGLPVTNCPIGLTNEGLPVGLQVVANPCQDRLTIAVAKEFERIFGGWVPPPSLESITSRGG